MSAVTALVGYSGGETSASYRDVQMGSPPRAPLKKSPPSPKRRPTVRLSTSTARRGLFPTRFVHLNVTLEDPLSSSGLTTLKVTEYILKHADSTFPAFQGIQFTIGTIRPNTVRQLIESLPNRNSYFTLQVLREDDAGYPTPICDEFILPDHEEGGVVLYNIRDVETAGQSIELRITRDMRHGDSLRTQLRLVSASKADHSTPMDPLLAMRLGGYSESEDSANSSLCDPDSPIA